MKTYKITDHISYETIEQLMAEPIKLELSPGAKKAIKQNRDYLDRKLKAAKDPIYGINTGFGSLHNKHIADADLEKLQENLVMSHACGTGAVSYTHLRAHET
jgi:histidine ammonia-lyase